MVENKITKNKYFYSASMVTMAIVITLALVFIVIMPFFNKAKELTTETKIKKEELARLTEKKTKLEELKVREEELKAQADRVENALPEEKDVGRLFIQLESLARSNGGEPQSVNESGGQPVKATTGQETQTAITPTIEKITYTMPINFRSYLYFRDFVVKSEKALRLITIDDFDLSSEDNTFNVNLTLTSYVRAAK